MIHFSLDHFDLAWTIVAGLLTPGIVSVYYSSMQKRYFCYFYVIQPTYYFDFLLISGSHGNWMVVILRVTSTLLLGPCLSFWDINCTDIGVGQLCGLSLCVCQSFNCVRLLQPHGLYPTRLPCPWNSPSKNTRVGCHLFSPGDLPDPGIEPRSRALQANYLPSEPPGTVSSSLLFDHIRPR